MKKTLGIAMAAMFVLVGVASFAAEEAGKAKPEAAAVAADKCKGLSGKELEDCKKKSEQSKEQQASAPKTEKAAEKK